jgi:hypothetical protein
MQCSDVLSQFSNLTGRRLRPIYEKFLRECRVELRELQEELEQAAKLFLATDLNSAVHLAISRWSRCCALTRLMEAHLVTATLCNWKVEVNHMQYHFTLQISSIEQHGENLIHILDAANRSTDQANCAQYLASMRARKTLANRAAEGLTAVGEEILNEYVTDTRRLPKSDITLPSSAFSQEAEGLADAYVMWVSVRFLRHKAFYALLELTREVGPHLESIPDHLAISQSSLVRTTELLAAVKDPTLSSHRECFSKQIRLFNQQFIARLEAMRDSSDTSDQKVAEQMRDELAPKLAQSVADLIAVEEQLQQALTSCLGTEISQQGWDDFQHAGDISEILHTLHGASASEIPSHFYEPLLDRVLFEKFEPCGEIDTPEAAALILFSAMAAKQGTEACDYLIDLMDFEPAEGVLWEEVCVGFCGILYGEAEHGNISNLPGPYWWLDKAVKIADGREAAKKIGVVAAEMMSDIFSHISALIAKKLGNSYSIDLYEARAEQAKYVAATAILRRKQMTLASAGAEQRAEDAVLA